LQGPPPRRKPPRRGRRPRRNAARRARLRICFSMGPGNPEHHHRKVDEQTKYGPLASMTSPRLSHFPLSFRVLFVLLALLFACLVWRACGSEPRAVSPPSVEEAGAISDASSEEFRVVLGAHPILGVTYTAGTCVALDGAPLADAGILCNGICVNPTNDNNNCNGCGQVCPCGASWNYCENCVDASCCIAAGSTCQYAPTGACCPGTTCLLSPSGTKTCQ
jgi:hypothetical protein